MKRGWSDVVSQMGFVTNLRKVFKMVFNSPANQKAVFESQMKGKYGTGYELSNWRRIDFDNITAIDYYVVLDRYVIIFHYVIIITSSKLWKVTTTGDDGRPTGKSFREQMKEKCIEYMDQGTEWRFLLAR